MGHVTNTTVAAPTDSSDYYCSISDVKTLLSPQVQFGTNESIGQVPDVTILEFIVLADGIIDTDLTGLYATPLQKTWVNGVKQFPTSVRVLAMHKASALLLNKKFGEIEPALSDRAKELEGRYNDLMGRIISYADIIPGQRKYGRSHFVTPGIQETGPSSGGASSPPTINTGGTQ